MSDVEIMVKCEVIVFNFEIRVHICLFDSFTVFAI